MAGRNIVSTLLSLLLLYVLCSREISAEDRVQELCKECRELAYSFNIGLEVTNRKGYSGGDVVWEEKKLGKYENSEVRFLDVVEKTCPNKNFQCNTMLENYEEDIEKWFFKLREDEKDFTDWLCIKTVKVCCPYNTFGPNCQACPGNGEFGCNQHGLCDGNGTKSGNGGCKCDIGYTGSACENCSSGYLRIDSDCHACHTSCDGDCLSEGPKGCIKCASGWEHTEESGCTDINECKAEVCDPVMEDCVNTDGSFTCNCKKGFQKEGDVCVPAEPDVIDAEAATSEADNSGDENPATQAVEDKKAVEIESHEEL